MYTVLSFTDMTIKVDEVISSLMSDENDRSEHTAWQNGYFNFLLFLDSISILINETRMI